MKAAVKFPAHPAEKKEWPAKLDRMRILLNSPLCSTLSSKLPGFEKCTRLHRSRKRNGGQVWILSDADRSDQENREKSTVAKNPSESRLKNPAHSLIFSCTIILAGIQSFGQPLCPIFTLISAVPGNRAAKNHNWPYRMSTPWWLLCRVKLNAGAGAAPTHNGWWCIGPRKRPSRATR